MADFWAAIQFSIPPGGTVEGEWQKALDAYFQDREQLDVFLRATAPCGKIIEYRKAEDVPLVDTPCLCGDPNHWIVKIVHPGVAA